MQVLFILLAILEGIVSFLLIGVILIQRSKGGGLGVSMGGGMGEAVFGARMGNVLTRVTVVLAAIFLLNTTVLSVLSAARWRQTPSIVDRLPPEPEAPAQPREGILPDDLPFMD